MAKITVEKFKEAVEKSSGNMTVIAERIGVSRQALYKWLSKRPKHDEFRKESKEEFKDLVRRSIEQRIIKGSENMMKFYAKNQLPEYRKDKADEHEKDIQIIVNNYEQKEAIERALNDEI